MSTPNFVRLARAGDAPALAAIDAHGEISPWSEAQFVVACAGSGPATALVWDDGSRIVGYVVFSQVLDEASIQRLAVDPVRRGQGLGQALLQAALDCMRRDGARRCLLEVRQSNTVAHRLYAANGFSLDGVRKNYYPTDAGREDALLMSRTL